MARELQNILSSGEITELKISGTDAGDAVLTSDQIDAKDATVTSAFQAADAPASRRK